MWSLYQSQRRWPTLTAAQTGAAYLPAGDRNEKPATRQPKNHEPQHKICSPGCLPCFSVFCFSFQRWRKTIRKYTCPCGVRMSVREKKRKKPARNAFHSCESIVRLTAEHQEYRLQSEPVRETTATDRQSTVRRETRITIYSFRLNRRRRRRRQREERSWMYFTCAARSVGRLVGWLVGCWLPVGVVRLVVFRANRNKRTSETPATNPWWKLAQTQTLVRRFSDQKAQA